MARAALNTADKLNNRHTPARRLTAAGNPSPPQNIMTKKNTAAALDGIAAALAAKHANPCPNAGSLIIDKATLAGIERMCNNVSETIFLRLKNLFTAAVFASQCAEKASELVGVRNMMEWQLADMFERLEKDCNQQLEFHVSGANPFADVQPEILI